MEAIRHALALDPEDAAPTARWAARTSSATATSAAAAECYEKAIALNPQAGWYRAAARPLLRAAARASSAGEAAARRAVALQEDFLSGREGLLIVGAHMRLGHLAALQGRHEQAIEHFQPRARLPPAGGPRAAEPHPRSSCTSGWAARTCGWATPPAAARSWTSRSRGSSSGCASAPTSRSAATTRPARYAVRGDVDPALDPPRAGGAPAAALHGRAGTDRAGVRRDPWRAPLQGPGRGLRALARLADRGDRGAAGERRRRRARRAGRARVAAGARPPAAPVPVPVVPMPPAPVVPVVPAVLPAVVPVVPVDPPVVPAVPPTDVVPAVPPPSVQDTTTRSPVL